MSKHKDVRTRLGLGTISYKSLNFVYPCLVSRGRQPNWIEVRLCTLFLKLCNALLHGRETYTYYWKNKQTNKQKKKKKREIQTCVITWWHKTTDKTDHYMEYLRFSLRLKLLSHLHSFVLSIKRKRGKGGWFNFSGRVCVTKRLARG